MADQLATDNRQVIHRFRCIACGATEDIIQNVIQNFNVRSMFGSAPPEWNHFSGMWVCHNHKLNITIEIDGRILDGYTIPCAWAPSKIDPPDISRELFLRDNNTEAL